MTLLAFLAKKPLFYSRFDPERIHTVWNRIKIHFALPPVVHLVGTNGKGTTGRFLATYLQTQGRRTGHYTSPHIARFNERIWLNGRDADDTQLDAAHIRLLNLLNPTEAASLSYFEYTTLLAAAVFEKSCDMIVMEAGLGGEFDATSIFEDALLLVTPIGIDHRDFLGTTIREIARTKLNILKSDVIVGFQNDPVVYELAAQIAASRGKQASFLKKPVAQETETDYLDENRLLALAAARYLGFDATLTDFGANTLFGRFSPLASNITVDVGHNALAARAVQKRLGKRKVKLVYNTLEDKEYETILRILKPNITEVAVIPIHDVRALPEQKLKKTLEKLNIPYHDFTTVDPAETYLVFGSFKTVEAFCKRFNET
jgi:dihydrofolate synthase/folylpolyglutamate synthase